MAHTPLTPLSRRALGRCALGGLGASVTACQTNPGTRFCGLYVASESELAEDDIVDFEYPEGHAAFLIKLRAPAETGVGQDDTLVAFHRACPHQGCPIADINLDKGQLGPCGCHYSVFDLRRRGVQVTGRATQNLVQVRLELKGDDIYATGVDGVPFGEAFTAKEQL